MTVKKVDGDTIELSMTKVGFSLGVAAGIIGLITGASAYIGLPVRMDNQEKGRTTNTELLIEIRTDLAGIKAQISEIKGDLKNKQDKN